ncbi:MAG: winged helix DNA-binding domain-containing protein [Anaerolineales bacterium]
MMLTIPEQRLFNQQISKQIFQKPSQVIRWLGAVQAQDYAAAKWAVAQRTKGVSDSTVDRAFDKGEFLRTHVMRPTWHFVAPEDIRWLLALTAPRVRAANAYQYRRLELDKTIFKKSNAALTKALRDGKHLTRAELASALQQAGIDASDLLRLTYLILSAELDGVICSGARRGKHFTYALLDERVPAAKTLVRDEALAELTLRYFTSHGPATEKDFMWWSGLIRVDVRSGIEMAKQHLEHDAMNGQTYWFADSMTTAEANRRAIYLLPNFDEYIVGYTDRSAIFDSSHVNKLDARSNPLFQHTIVINGQVAGTWKRTLKKDAVIIELNSFVPFTKSEKQIVAAAAEKYGRFLEMPVALSKLDALETY